MDELATADGDARPILILTSSLLTDRMLMHSSFFDVTGRRDVVVWATSMRNARVEKAWAEVPAVVEPFPTVVDFRERFNYFRRLNESAWDHALAAPSRLSAHRHTRVGRESALVRVMRLIGRACGQMRLHVPGESVLLKVLGRQERSAEATERLKSLAPAAVLCMNPFWHTEQAVVLSARRLGIPVFAFVPSWDNISTKSRPVSTYDAYFVWAERDRTELAAYYPTSAGRAVHVVGAPQFDVFRQDQYFEARPVFCGRNGLDPSMPIILHAVGSPNFLDEKHAAVELAGRVARGELGDVQLLVRPHPIHDRNELRDLFSPFGARVVLQGHSEPERILRERSMDASDIRDWVNTFRHADVVVNLSSTVTIDGAIFDKPVVNIDYDAAPAQPQAALIHDINHVWAHSAPVANSGGVWMVKSNDEMAEAVRAYLNNPARDRERRRWIVEFVCGEVDGRAGSRLAAGLFAEVDRMSVAP